MLDPKGYPDNPLTEEDLQGKFADCARGQPESVRASYPLWRNAAAQASVRAMCARLQQVRTGASTTAP
jgi:hypothetical protein